MPEFKVATYTLNGLSVNCPNSTIKQGELVIGFNPLKKIDPLGMFAFVMDKDGDTQTVSRRFLKKETELTLTYEAKKHMSAHYEMFCMLEAMRNYFKEVKIKK